jgi:hypothetical protein
MYKLDFIKIKNFCASKGIKLLCIKGIKKPGHRIGENI